MPTKLTDRVVAAAAPPASGQLFIRDTEIKGFALRVLASGVRSFVFECKFRGRFIRRTIGQYSTVTVPIARQIAADMKLKLWQARRSGAADPFAAPAPPLTFGLLADRYVNEHSKVAKQSWKRDERRLALYFGDWRARGLGEVTAGDVAHVRDAIAGAHGKVEANRAIELVKAVFNKAAEWELFDGCNPASAVTRFKEHARERFLSPAEIQAVIRALDNEASPFWRAFFLMSLSLGTRKNEGLGTRWADVDFDQRLIRFPQTKSGRPHLLPLPAPLLEVLAALPSRGVSEWVFPATQGASGHLTEPKKSWARIRQRAGIVDCTIHDLRRSLGSLLAGRGVDGLLIGRVLNHKSPSATAIYARFDNEPIRAALDAAAGVIFAGSNGAPPAAD